jgi:hypothetical protein
MLGLPTHAADDGSPMEREYDLFERSQDQAVIWRGCVRGLENARRKLQEIAARTTNECFAIHSPTRQIVALLNTARGSQRPAKRVVFQVAYDPYRLLTRAELLRHRGYEVVSVVGNEAAKVVLDAQQQHCDLFIVGHAAPDETRTEMVAWLKAKYPKVKILALNPPDHQLPDADYNVVLNGPNQWLSIVGSAVGSAAGV